MAQKFGEREVYKTSGILGYQELHDCGIVYYKQDSAYLLCVMTHGSDTTSLAKEIADISKLVYDSLVK